MRLDKYLLFTDIGLRKICQKYIKNGKIKVNNEIIKDPSYKVKQNDYISLNNQPLIYNEYIYLMFNKPNDCITATFDKDDKTVMDYINTYPNRNLFPVGRLDKTSEGLLLITDDGALAHRLLSPNYHVKKKYYIEYTGFMTTQCINELTDGLIMDQEKLQPAEFALIEQNENYSKAYITICEGKYHQVKRMMMMCNCQVTYLKRVSFGSLDLDPKLELSKFRLLTNEELIKIKKDANVL